MAIGGTNTDLTAPHPVGGGVTGGLCGEKHLVGNQQFRVVLISPEKGGAKAKLVDVAA